MNIIESIAIAFDSVRVNKLRAGLTLLSISIGVFAIVGAGTLVDSINTTVTGEMADLGEHSFAIYQRPKISMGNDWRKYMNRKPINYRQFKEFSKAMTNYIAISTSSSTGGQIIKYVGKETDPDVSIIGTIDSYFETNSAQISDGRPLINHDIEFNRNVAVIGNDIVVSLFSSGSPIGKEISVGNHKFYVIGVLESKGAILGQSQDNVVIIPITQYLKYFASIWDESLDITVKTSDKISLLYSIDEAIGNLRMIRGDQPGQDNSFEIATNQSITDQFSNFTKFLSIFGIVSGMISLIAAGVGIMNIMLVSVKERTREIGIRKAVGAKKIWILFQFMIEAVTLCQLGGIVGILMGIISASVFSTTLGLTLTPPVFWIIGSLIICTILGLIAGAYPAWRAAQLDPIDALRYE